MKKIYLLIVTTLFITFTGSALAGEYTFNLGQMDGLDHYRYYAWETSGFSLGDKEKITGASLFFDQIYNWKDPERDPNDLYLTLLDDNPLNKDSWRKNFDGTLPADGEAWKYWDNQNTPNAFSTIISQGGGIELKHWSNLPGKDSNGNKNAIDIDYQFTPGQIATLTSYTADNIFGLGFDPDCHFYNSGITLTIKTKEFNDVPEPSSILLFGVGLIGFAAGLRREKNTT